MANKNEHVDELLRKYLNEDTINESVNEFGKRVVESIHKVANEQGYDSFEDLVASEIKMNTSSQRRKPTIEKVKGCQTRYEYFVQSFENVTYDSRYRGNYKLGHMAAVERYYDKVELNCNNLSIVEKTLKQEIAEVRRQRDESLYAKGYLDGLRLVDKALRDSKNEMMKQVYQTVMDALK